MAGDGGVCSACGAAAPGGARFCMACGAALPGRATAEVRKTVTALSCDVVGSTTLAEGLDPEALRATMERWFGEVRAVLVRHGGTVEKFVGDAVMAVFGAPVTHEDDALRACRAALEILERTASTGRFQVRVGVETGEVVVGDVSRGSTFASGVPVILAARLQSAAAPGEALVGPSCQRLVRDQVVGEGRRGLKLKNMADPVDAVALVAVADVRDPVARSTLPLVGRTRELALLAQAFDRAAVDRTCQLATILGVAGMGKTRITDEFVEVVASRATVLRGRCVSYGEGVTFWPLVEVVRQAAGLDGGESPEDARARVAALLAGSDDVDQVVRALASVAGLGGTPMGADDTAWALRRLLEALSHERPVVLVVENLHWADPGLVTVLDEVMTWLREAPVLLLVNARTEFLDDNPLWGGGRVNGVTALLEPLVPDEVGELTVEVLGGQVPREAADRIRRVAGGNPLYVQHLLAVLVDEEVLSRAPGGWELVGDVAGIDVPPTIAALISARLDRLDPEERAALGVAAVMGEVFYREAVVALASDGPAAVHALAAVLRKGLVEPAESDLAGHEAMRFGHVLVRDSAYESLPKSARAKLHEGFARWLDGVGQGQVVDDFVGNHLEAAYLAHADLGRLDDAVALLGREASARLGAAGMSLLYADDGTAAALLERAARLAESGPSRWALQMELAYTLFRNGAPLRAAGVAEDFAAGTAAAGDIRWGMHARLLQAEARQATAPGQGTPDLEGVVAEALALFTELRDDDGLACVHDAASDVANRASDPEAFLRECLLAADHAERAGKFRQARMHRRSALLPMIMGRRPVSDGLAETRRQMATVDHRTARALLLSYLGYFTTLEGLEDEAEAAFAEAGRLAQELHPSVAEEMAFFRGLSALDTGQWGTAAAQFRRLLDETEAPGDLGVFGTNEIYLAHALLSLGELDEARRLVAQADRIGTEAGDVLTVAHVASTKAWLAAIDGDRTSVTRLTRQAIDLMPSDLLLDVGLAHVACAEAAARLADRPLQQVHLGLAVDAYVLKGNRVGEARLRHARAKLAVPHQ